MARALTSGVFVNVFPIVQLVHRPSIAALSLVLESVVLMSIFYYCWERWMFSDKGLAFMTDKSAPLVRAIRRLFRT